MKSAFLAATLTFVLVTAFAMVRFDFLTGFILGLFTSTVVGGVTWLCIIARRR